MIGIALLTGCTTAGGRPGIANPLSGAAGTKTSVSAIDPSLMTPAQREMRERNEKLKETVMEGVLIGAAAGTIIGAVVTGSGRGAVVGGLIGSGVGYLAGSAMAEMQGEEGKKLDTVEALTAAMRTKNGEAQQAIAGIEAVIAEDKKKIALLNRQLKSKKIDQAKYEQELSVVRADQEEIRTAAANMDKQVGSFEASLAEHRKKDDATISKDVEKAMSDMKKSNERLKAVSEVADRLMPPTRA
ncbi:glycine zipper domain-containing protein [Azospirillum palustre]